jgi:predicted nucleic acid-binding protein
VSQILFDSSVYISALRTKDDSALRARGQVAGERLWLSAVVLEELLAGSTGATIRLVERFGRDFDRIGRLLVPNAADWTTAGKLLARIGTRYGFSSIARSRMTNDVLISASASRLAIEVVTANARDFTRISEFLPTLRWRLPG